MYVHRCDQQLAIDEMRCKKCGVLVDRDFRRHWKAGQVRSSRNERALCIGSFFFSADGPIVHDLKERSKLSSKRNLSSNAYPNVFV